MLLIDADVAGAAPLYCVRDDDVFVGDFSGDLDIRENSFCFC